MEVEMALLLECQEELCAVVYTNCQWPDTVTLWPL